MKIGNIEIENKLVLAPMAGISDLPFRSICREFGAGLVYTEMVSAKALWFGDKKTETLLKTSNEEHPVAVQIFGSEPECLAFAAKKSIEISGGDILDINMGCPVGKIAKSGDGSGLMRNPALAREIMGAVVKASPVPVTIKLRKGWDEQSVNVIEFAKMAEDEGISAIAVHGRTRAQMYSGKADWDIIAEVKNAVNIPIIANGDIFVPGDVPAILLKTNADAAMVGRGALGNPWIFSMAAALLEGREPELLPSIAERVDTAVRQFEMAVSQKGEKIGCLEARKHYAWYLKGVPNASKMRGKINSIESMADIYRITEEIKANTNWTTDMHHGEC